MKILLAAINAKFSHTSLAVRYLKNSLLQEGFSAEFAEYTINQSTRDILADIAAHKPDALLFSCYLWNIEYVRRIGSDFRRLFPKARILLGGPEVSFDAQIQLDCFSWADAIVCGEGEEILPHVLRLTDPRGVFQASHQIDMDSLPFPYTDLPSLSNRVLYYESARGCPFGCSYCLSSADRTTRFRSLKLVFNDLQRFLDARVMQVKFVDRTFNLDAARALAIWRYLAAQDNGVTSFQMEIGGDLLTQEQILFLSSVRIGLFQFEIGVQSTCEYTLAEIARATDMEKLCQNVRAIQAGGNIHQHLDLIAGLPLESFARFTQSFDEVMALRPQQLQLGFLKLLRGSSLYTHKEQYGLQFSEYAPYEILQTPHISFAELATLKHLEAMTEVYYNSGRFSHTLEYLLTLCPQPSTLFLGLAQRMPARAVGKYEYYDLLFSHGTALGADPDLCRTLILFDITLHEKPRKLPVCCERTEIPKSVRIQATLLSLPKTSHVELFLFDVTDTDYTPTQTAVVFDYSTRDAGGHAQFKKLPIPLGEPIALI